MCGKAEAVRLRENNSIDAGSGQRTYAPANLPRGRSRLIIYSMLQQYFRNITGVRYRLRCLVAVGLLMAFSPVSGLSQTVAPTPTPPAATASPEKTPEPAPARADKIKRWFEFDEFFVAARYRFTENANGVTATNALQWRFGGKGKLKFDGRGRYGVVAGLYSGASFNSGWNATGWGTGRLLTNLYLKQLYVTARPIKPLEFQVGGLGINNGENTEATGYDSDGFIMGERVIVRHAKTFYFDEISLTNAFLGELNHPSVFRRFGKMSQSNYRQFLVRKQVNKRVGFSADYTFDRGTDTLREAIKIKTPEIRIADSITFENYQRFDGPGRYGFNLFGEKKINDKFSVNGGFVRIDAVLLNGDRFPRGNRLHTTATYKPRPDISIAAAVTQGVGPILPTLPRTRLDIVFTYNILQALRDHKLQ